MKKLFLSLMLIGAMTLSAGAHNKTPKYKKPASASKAIGHSKVGKAKKKKTASLNTVKASPTGKTTARSGKKISGVSKQFQANLGIQGCVKGNISSVEGPK